MGKHEKILNFEKKNLKKNLKKKSFGFGKKNFGSDTEIQPWFRFPIPIPNFGRTLVTLTPHDGR